MRRLVLTLTLLFAASSSAFAEDVYLFTVMKQTAYVRAVTALFKTSPRLPKWTGQILSKQGDYVAIPATYATIAGTQYQLHQICKAHDCDGNTIELMFAPGGSRAWGALIDDQKPVVYLGSPTPEQQAALKEALPQ